MRTKKGHSFLEKERIPGYSTKERIPEYMINNHKGFFKILKWDLERPTTQHAHLPTPRLFTLRPNRTTEGKCLTCPFPHTVKNANSSF